jgi:hypothetical protein
VKLTNYLNGSADNIGLITEVRFTLTSLLLTFTTLKLAGLVTWGWIWVLTPFWIPAVVATVSFIIVICIKTITLKRTTQNDT